MKKLHRPNNINVEIEDAEFLSQLAAVEADVVANKRKKVRANEEEGLYTAALRGSHSFSPNFPPKVTAVAKGRNDGVPVGAGDSCFKCGRSGHWARDCVDSPPGRHGGGHIGNFEKDADVAEKACPCGMGPCSIFTANTEKNRGRKFYRCPVREESGGCGFFEWCDNAAGTRMTAVSASPYKSSYSISEKNKPSYNSGGSRSACFRCGKEGHWAKDCTMASTNAPAVAQGSVASNTCYKCNKAGHWAKDCSSN